MKPTFKLFWTFLKELSKKWLLWLFLALDIAGAVIQILVPSLKPPQGVYLGLFVLGLILASFQTYLELLEKIPSRQRPLEPKISLFLVEGNEYFYGFQESEDILHPELLSLVKKKVDNTKESPKTAYS
jgi:hypothetical protein